MRRRALLSATAAAISTPLVAGCSRDDGGGGGGGGGDGEGDGGGGDGGGGGPYGDVDPAGPQMAVGQVDGAGPDGSDDGATGHDGPALGPEPGGG